LCIKERKGKSGSKEDLKSVWQQFSAKEGHHKEKGNNPNMKQK
jgi:hypothetical protein